MIERFEFMEDNKLLVEHKETFSAYSEDVAIMLKRVQEYCEDVENFMPGMIYWWKEGKITHFVELVGDIVVHLF